MGDRLRWDVDGRDWPHAACSRFVDAGGVAWHLQRTGPAGAPVLLLLHGTGASTHSWRGLLAPLSHDFDVLAVDLPGHGFSSPPQRPADAGLAGMAAALAALLHTLGLAPAVIVGHSAGAAIGAQLCLAGGAAPRLLVGLNAALLPLAGLAGRLFSPVARVLATTPWAPRLFARRAADPAVLQRLLAGTGSTLDAEGAGWYRRLVDSPGHVAGALAMMANWQLEPFARALPTLRVPLVLLVGDRDATVPPDQSWRVAQRVAGARVMSLGPLGHLAHEERPAEVAALLRRLAVEAGVLASGEQP